MATAWSDDGDALIASIHRSPFAAVISDPRLPANPIIAANASFCELTGYPRHEVIGHNCKFLAGTATEPWLTERIGEGIRRREPVLVEILNYKRDRTPFRNAVLVAPIFDPGGELRYFIGSQVELPADGGERSFSRRERAVAMVKTLSPRQRQILEQIAAGHRSKQIAWRLRLSEKTVKMHRALLLRKLDNASTADAIRIAVEAGL